MAKKVVDRLRYQEMIAARPGTRAKLVTLKRLFEAEKGVPVSGAVALELALTEILAARNSDKPVMNAEQP